MKRRFNPTGRKRITLDRISITLFKTNHKVESFSVLLKLDGMGLPDEAKVYIEAYHRSELLRYYFGTVGNIVSPEDTGLSHLAHHEALRFRVLVVDESVKCGLILASADGIRPTGMYRKRSILPVEFRDLGRQVWKVDYSAEEPILLLNERIPGIHNLARTDPHFRLYIYPAVIRDIFTHMFFIDRLDDIEDPLQEWHKNWLEFAKRFLPEDTLSQLNLQGEQSDPGGVLDWLDKLVEEFCFSRNKEWRKLVSIEEVG